MKKRKRYKYKGLICQSCAKSFSGGKRNSKYCSKECFSKMPKTFSKRTFSKKEIYDLYFNQKLSFYKIAHLKDYAVSTITYWFNKWGFKARNGSESQKGKLNHSYKDGIKDNLYRAYIRDKKRCKLCRYNRIVNIHHIIPRHNDGKNKLNNLITLCPNCHSLVHQNIIKIYSLDNIIDSKKNHKKYSGKKRK